MIKKTISLLLIMALVVSFTACGGEVSNTEVPNQNNDSTTASTHNETSTTTDPTSAQVSKEQVIQIPGREIYFSAAVDWTVDKDDFSIMLYENKDRMVAIGYDRVSDFDGNYDELIRSISKDYISEASSKCQGYIRNSTLEITSTEMSKISDYECKKFTGTIDNDGNWDCYVYGYAYIVDGVNLMVLGIVSAPEQSSTMIAEIEALTDQIATSVRTQK